MSYCTCSVSTIRVADGPTSSEKHPEMSTGVLKNISRLKLPGSLLGL